jgi:hypothetical protein
MPVIILVLYNIHLTLYVFYFINIHLVLIYFVIFFSYIYIYIDFTSQIVGWRGSPLSHKQGGLIHQFGVWLGRELKNRLLLLYSDLC